MSEKQQQPTIRQVIVAQCQQDLELVRDSAEKAVSEILREQALIRELIISRRSSDPSSSKTSE